jgi:arylsulfatase
LAYTFADPAAPSRRSIQYFELLQNAAIYRDGWVAATTPTYMPWNLFQSRREVPFEARQWELYNVSRDFSQARNLAASNPAKLKEMQALFRSEAERNHVFPLHSPAAGAVGRPRFEPRDIYTYTGDVRTIHVEAAPPIGGRSFEIIADVTVTAREADGVMAAHGGRFSGYSFYLNDGRPTFAYNAVPPRMATIGASRPLGPGRHIVAAKFKSAEGAPGEGGSLVISVDGQEVARGQITHTLPRIWFTEGLDIGRDLMTPVSSDYVSPAPFPGLVNKLEIRLSPGISPK